MTIDFPAISPRYPASATEAASASDPLTSRASSSLPRFWNPYRVGPGANAVTATPVPFNSLARASENDRT